MMILKVKKIIVVSLTLSCSTVFAGIMGALATPEHKNGFYIGADIGLSNLMDKFSFQINPETHQLGSLGIVGGGLIGYDYNLTHEFKLSLEGFCNANGLNTSIRHYFNNDMYQASSNYNAGVRILPSYEFQPGANGHIILGYTNARYQIQDNTYGIINTSFNQNGFQTGLGWMAAITPCLFMRLDGLYSIYADQTSSGLSLPGSSTPLQSYTNDFSTLEGDLTLIYKFN